MVSWMPQMFLIGTSPRSMFFGGDLRTWLSNEAGISYDQRNALVVGCAMGFAVIPTIFSIAEDARVDVVVTNLYDALVHALQRQSRFLLLIGVAMAVVGVLQWLQMRREADRAAASTEA